MFRHFNRSPFFIFLFIIFLAVPQFFALETQFARGFRPFIHEPTRVPFSWDMFTTRVERCILEWSPPIQLGIHKLKGLRDVGLPFEWDITYDRPLDYRNVGQWACTIGAFDHTQERLRCFLQSGVEFKDEFTCK